MRIHFVGIGGIGTSALAEYYLKKGYKISGSDLVSSEITRALKNKGVKVFIPHQSRLKKNKLPDLVIYSPAVPEDNPELKHAKKLGIKCQTYPEALGELTKKHFTIAVSGTHGKSTTTAMIGLILIKAGFDPTIIVGTKLKEFGDSNCRVGKSKYFVIEADEHMASFLNYWPKIIVLTSVEKDHLDYYGNLKNILKTFKKYIGHLPEDGILVANKDDKNTSKLLKNIKSNKIKNIKNEDNLEKLRKILKVPGEHNLLNALAAFAVARVLKISDRTSLRALSEYRGAWRRFEIKKLTINGRPRTNSFGMVRGRQLTIVNDYAHHPTEIKATLKAAREKYPRKQIWCAFQPHQHQRTFYLFKDFVRVLSRVPINMLIVADIYDVAGRENKKIKKRINSEKLVNKIKILKRKFKDSVIYIPTIKGIFDYLKKNLRGGEVLIIMGAGDIYELNKRFNFFT